MPISNKVTFWLFLVLCFIHSTPLLIGQSAGTEILANIQNNLNEDRPEANDPYVLQFHKKHFDHFDCEVRGRILHNLALGLYYQNREVEAIPLFTQALNKVWNKCDGIDALEKANTAFNIGVCYQYTAEATLGKPYIEQAMAVFTTHKSYPKSDLCYKYQGAANFFSTLKDFTKAELYYKAAEKLAYSVPTEDQFHLYNEFFVLYLSFSEWEAALQKAEQLTQFAQLYRKQIDKLSLALLYLNKAQLLLNIGQRDQVVKACQTALQLLPPDEAEFRSNAHEILGVYYLEEKDFTNSQKQYEKAFALRSASQNIVQANLARAFSFENLAEISMQVKDYERAMHQINQAIALLSSPCVIDQQGNPILRNCITANGINLIRELQLKQKINLAAKSNDLTGLIQNQVISYKLDSLSAQVLQQAYVDESKLFVLSQLGEKTETQVATALALYRQTKEQQYLVNAADFVSGSKSLVLRQFLDQNKLLLLKKGNKNFDNVFRLREKLNRLRTDIETSQSIPDSLFAQTNALMSALEAEENKTGIATQQSFQNDQSVSSTLQKLDDRTLVIESFSGREWLHFFIFSRQGLQHQTWRRAEVEGLVQKLKASLEKPEKPYDKESAGMLWSLCFEKIIGEAGIKKLVFIPDGYFHGLPIEALVQKNGKYVLEDYVIQYSHSSQMVFKKEEARTFTRQFTGFATAYGNTLNQRISGIPHFKGLHLQTLNNAVRELESSAQHFSNQMYLSKAANPGTFRSHGPSSEILYFSLHSVANEKNGSLSALIFDDQNKDFVLHSYEINAIPLNAKLVVLSSCQSASGKIFSGEGIQGLTRSFLLAGCEQVVSSIWNASEQSAGMILPAFMERVAGGEDHATALRDAKLGYLSKASPSQKHPYYWAGFVMNGSLEDKKTGWLQGLRWIVLGAAMALLYWIGRKKFRKRNK